VIGRSHLRGESRNFILENIEEVKILDENYTLDKEINVERLIYASDEISETIILEVEKREIGRLEANLPAKIISKDVLNSKIIKVTFKFDNLVFINEWLLQFGNKVKVLSPDSLIDKRKSLLRDMLDN
jgi:predicted DNA-binding transcriptional regulator YafY